VLQAFTFLAASVSARWLATRTTLGRTGTALAAFAVALILGLLSLRLFGLSLRPPMRAASGARCVPDPAGDTRSTPSLMRPCRPCPWPVHWLLP
jgi:hypothetical protein